MAGIPHDHYEPVTSGEKWLNRRLPIAGLLYDTLMIPTPKNLNWWWIWGIVLAFTLVLQIVTGIILAFFVVAHIFLFKFAGGDPQVVGGGQHLGDGSRKRSRRAGRRRAGPPAGRSVPPGHLRR